MTERRRKEQQQQSSQETTIVFMPSSPQQIILANLHDGEGQNWGQLKSDSDNPAKYTFTREDDEEITCAPADGLIPITNCCLKRQCYVKFQQAVQEDCFNRFWSIKCKSNQNYFLAGLMSAESPKRRVSNPVRNNKSHSWHYYVDVRGQKVQVCQHFFTGVYGISNSRIQTIQNKLVTGASIDDLRGKFSKRKDSPESLAKRPKKSKN